MNKEFIPYEQALSMEKLGFVERCFGFYTLEGYYFPNTTPLNSLTYGCDAPLYQQAFRWFREKYMTKRSINERGDYIEGNFFMLPLIFPNGYEIKLLKPSTSYTIVGGREIHFMQNQKLCIKKLLNHMKVQNLLVLKN